MSEDSKNKYEIPFYGQMPGHSELSEMELSCIRAAGIDPDMLSAADRAAVIRALTENFDLIKNPHAGDVAALLFQFGLLQDMLSDEKREEWEEEVEEKKEKEKKRKEREEELFRAEMQRMQEMQAGQYYAENPLPPYIFEPVPDFYQNSQISQASDFAVPYVEALQEALLLPVIETVESQTNSVDLESTVVALPPVVDISTPSDNPIANLDLSNLDLSHMLGLEITHHNEHELPKKAKYTPEVDDEKPEIIGQIAR